MSATKPEYNELPMHMRGVVAKASHVKLLALNAELLAALIQMENWASLYAPYFRPDSLYRREIKQARAVVAKAKELEL